MKRTTIRGVRIIREPYQAAELRYTLDHFDAAGNLIDTLGRYPDLASGRKALDAAARHRPQRHLSLRDGARVIAKHEPRGNSTE